MAGLLLCFSLCNISTLVSYKAILRFYDVEIISKVLYISEFLADLIQLESTKDKQRVKMLRITLKAYEIKH